MTAMVVILSVTVLQENECHLHVYMYTGKIVISHTHTYNIRTHVYNHISTYNHCITYILHTSHIKCGMAAQLFLSVTELQGEPGPVKYTMSTFHNPVKLLEKCQRSLTSALNLPVKLCLGWY